jgi:hypothetical protein
MFGLTALEKQCRLRCVVSDRTTSPGLVGAVGGEVIVILAFVRAAPALKDEGADDRADRRHSSALVGPLPAACGEQDARGLREELSQAGTSSSRRPVSSRSKADHVAERRANARLG